MTRGCAWCIARACKERHPAATVAAPSSMQLQLFEPHQMREWPRRGVLGALPFRPLGRRRLRSSGRWGCVGPVATEEGASEDIPRALDDVDTPEGVALLQASKGGYRAVRCGVGAHPHDSAPAERGSSK